MPSPTFGARGVVPDAVALAVREAWAVGDPHARTNVLNRALRRILGDRLADQVLPAAVTILRAQPQAPAGDIEPPALAVLDLCARCRRVKLREERRPFRGKIRLEILRDAGWMRRQFEQLGRTDADVAAELACSKMSVQLWRQRHDIDPGKQHQPWMHEETLRRLIEREQLAPGEVAEQLGCQVWTVRGWASRFGIAKQKGGWAHLERAWWQDRVAAGWTQYKMAAAAGLKTHTVLYWLRKFGLYREKDPASRSRLRKTRYPQLYEIGWLRTQLERGRTYAAIAKQVGCAPTLVAFAAKKLGLVAPGPQPYRPYPWKHDAAWYRARFAERRTVDAMAAEAGVKPKSIWNYVGELGLLEEYHRQVERWDDAHLAKTRERTLRRQRQQLAAEAIA